MSGTPHSHTPAGARKLVPLLRVVCAASGCLGAASPAHAANDVDYNRHVRPILASHCYECHGPDPSSREAELRLDEPEDALRDRDGRAAFVPGKPSESEALRRVKSEDLSERMPPEGKKPLSASEIDVVQQWIEAGARYQPHWAFVPPVRPTPPKVRDASWPRGPVDAFVLSKIEQAGLIPSPPADWRTLVRRAALDLTGLPPLPEEIAAFEAEAATGSFDEAYAKYVDRLLASPHYGERWARRWLDLARYADTNGYEKDRTRSMWPYRDWVVRALNSDMPFNQFTIEQIAGDMLHNASVDQQIASGFHRNTMLNEEGGIDPLEFRFLAMTDRVATTGVAWLGLTLGCAQCHSHKYDPITHLDYYSLMALLDNADEPEIELPTPELETHYREDLARAEKIMADLCAKWPFDDRTTISSTSTSLSADSSVDTASPADPKTDDPDALAELRDDFAAWISATRRKTANWRRLRPVQADSNSPLLTVQSDDSIFASGDITKHDVYRLAFRPQMQQVVGIRLEAIPDDRLPGRGPGMTYYEGTKGDFFLGEIRFIANGQPLAIRRATHSYAHNQYGSGDDLPVSASLTIDGDVQTGWSVAGRSGERHTAVYALETPIDLQTLELTLEMGRHFASSLGRFRVSAASLDPDHPSGAAQEAHDPEAPEPEAPEPEAFEATEALESLLRKPNAELTSMEKRRLWEEFLLRTPKLAEQSAEITRLRKRPEHPTTLVLRERPADNRRVTHRHHRGEYLQPAEVVKPQVPPVLHPFPEKSPRNRLGFAEWLVAPQNPLAARVVVNRQWAALFGRGLVSTVDDFGTQGASPSHPELLDWLAVEFVEHGWSLKSLHRMLATSAAYRQSSQASLAAAEKDPENILLSHAPRPRLDAETLRDVVLHCSGLLEKRMGGPGVYPPQPIGVTEAAYGSPSWPVSEGADRYRRSLYTFRKRSAPFAMYDTFDAPSGEACKALREASNTPLQALTLVNDAMFLEAAQALGRMLVDRKAEDDAARTRYAFQRILVRPPAAEELPMLLAFVEKQRARFAAESTQAAEFAGAQCTDVAEAATWTALSRALMSLDETITRN